MKRQRDESGYTYDSNSNEWRPTSAALTHKRAVLVFGNDEVVNIVKERLCSEDTLDCTTHCETNFSVNINDPKTPRITRSYNIAFVDAIADVSDKHQIERALLGIIRAQYSVFHAIFLCFSLDNTMTLSSEETRNLRQVFSWLAGVEVAIHLVFTCPYNTLFDARRVLGISAQLRGDVLVPLLRNTTGCYDNQVIFVDHQVDVPDATPDITRARLLRVIIDCEEPVTLAQIRIMRSAQEAVIHQEYAEQRLKERQLLLRCQNMCQAFSVAMKEKDAQIAALREIEPNQGRTVSKEAEQEVEEARAREAAYIKKVEELERALAERDKKIAVYKKERVHHKKRTARWRELNHTAGQSGRLTQSSPMLLYPHNACTTPYSATRAGTP